LFTICIIQVLVLNPDKWDNFLSGIISLPKLQIVLIGINFILLENEPPNQYGFP